MYGKGSGFMKKILIYVLCVIIALTTIVICLKLGKDTAVDEPENNATIVDETENGQTSDKDIAEIPVNVAEEIAEQSKNGITIAEAEQLCADVLGDKAEENDFPISYKCISAVSANNSLYYVMNISWLVNGEHWSYIGNCYVSFDGCEIYDGIVSGEEHEIMELRWKK